VARVQLDPRHRVPRAWCLGPQGAGPDSMGYVPTGPLEVVAESICRHSGIPCLSLLAEDGMLWQVSPALLVSVP